MKKTGLEKLYSKIIKLKNREKNDRINKLYKDLIKLIIEYYKDTSIGEFKWEKQDTK